MEEKKMDYRYKLIIGLLVICIIGVLMTYLIADKLAIKMPDENTINEGEVQAPIVCEYDILPDPNSLSYDERAQIIDLLSRNNTSMEIDVETVKIDSIDNHTYSVEFEYVKKEGSYALKDILWRKNGLWEDYGPGSDFMPEEYERVHLNICTSCSDEC